MITDDDIREVFLKNGFTVKEGQTDLKPYVFAAARALIELERQRAVELCEDIEAKYGAARNRYEDGLYDAAMVIGARIGAGI